MDGSCGAAIFCSLPSTGRVRLPASDNQTSHLDGTVNHAHCAGWSGWTGRARTNRRGATVGAVPPVRVRRNAHGRDVVRAAASTDAGWGDGFALAATYRHSSAAADQMSRVLIPQIVHSCTKTCLFHAFPFFSLRLQPNLPSLFFAWVHMPCLVSLIFSHFFEHFPPPLPHGDCLSSTSCHSASPGCTFKPGDCARWQRAIRDSVAGGAAGDSAAAFGIALRVNTVSRWRLGGGGQPAAACPGGQRRGGMDVAAAMSISHLPPCCTPGAIRNTSPSAYPYGIHLATAWLVQHADRYSSRTIRRRQHRRHLPY